MGTTIDHTTAQDLIRISRAHPGSIVLQKEVHQVVGRGESFFENSQDYRTLRNIDQHLDWESAPWAETFVGGTQGNAARNLALRPAGLWGTPPPESPPVGGPAGWWILGAMVVMGVLKAMEQNPLVDPRRAIMPDTGIRVTDALAPTEAPLTPDESAVVEASEELDAILERRGEEGNLPRHKKELEALLVKLQENIRIAVDGVNREILEQLQLEAQIYHAIFELDLWMAGVMEHSVQEEIEWHVEADRIAASVRHHFGDDAETLERFLDDIAESKSTYDGFAAERWRAALEAVGSPDLEVETWQEARALLQESLARHEEFIAALETVLLQTEPESRTATNTVLSAALVQSEVFRLKIGIFDADHATPAEDRDWMRRAAALVRGSHAWATTEEDRDQMLQVLKNLREEFYDQVVSRYAGRDAEMTLADVDYINTLLWQAHFLGDDTTSLCTLLVEIQNESPDAAVKIRAHTGLEIFVKKRQEEVARESAGLSLRQAWEKCEEAAQSEDTIQIAQWVEVILQKASERNSMDTAWFKLMTHRSLTVRMAAVQLLRNHAKDAAVRILAIWPAQIRAIQTALSEGDEGIKEVAVVYLGLFAQFGIDGARRMLQQLAIDDSHPDLQQSALEALSGFSPPN